MPHPRARQVPSRLHELDWLRRVLVILDRIPYHATWLLTFVPGFTTHSADSQTRITRYLYGTK